MNRLALGVLVLLAAVPGHAKEGYNLWAKEKIRYLHSKVQRNPHNPELHMLLANAYYRDGRHFDAEKHLQEALTLAPDYAEAHCNLGVVLQAQGRLEAASQSYKAALAQDSTMMEALSGLGTLLCRLERQEEGLPYLEKVLADDPRRSNTRYNLAVAYHKIGDFKMAIYHLETLLEHDAIYPGARLALSRAYYSQGLITLQAQQAAAAVALLDKALKFERQEPDFFFAKGLAHFACQEYDPAADAYKAAIRLDSSHVGALQNLATIYDLTDRPEAAHTYYLKVQKLVPHLTTIEAARNAEFGVEHLIR